MKEPISEVWLTDEALRIAGNLLDGRLERDASVIHQLVRRVRQGSDARIAELEAELAMSRAANGELIAERLRGESAARIAELEAEVARYRAANVITYEQLEKLEAERGALNQLVAGRGKRIDELEAERANYVHDETDAIRERRIQRIAELEAALASYDAGKSDREILAQERIAELEAALLAEREACAQAADDFGPSIPGQMIAAAIRARPAP